MLKSLSYINDNYIDINTPNYKHILSDGISAGEIINRDLFINDFKRNVKNKSILSKSIKILLNKDIKESDLLYYTSIFEELNYNKIILSSTSNYLDNDTLIINGKSYVLYHDKNYIKIKKDYLNDYLSIFKISKLKIISNKQLPTNNLCKYYYYNNSEKYFFI